MAWSVLFIYSLCYLFLLRSISICKLSWISFTCHSFSQRIIITFFLLSSKMNFYPVKILWLLSCEFAGIRISSRISWLCCKPFCLSNSHIQEVDIDAAIVVFSKLERNAIKTSHFLDWVGNKLITYLRMTLYFFCNSKSLKLSLINWGSLITTLKRIMGIVYQDFADSVLDLFTEDVTLWKKSRLFIVSDFSYQFDCVSFFNFDIEFVWKLCLSLFLLL